MGRCLKLRSRRVEPGLRLHRPRILALAQTQIGIERIDQGLDVAADRLDPVAQMVPVEPGPAHDRGKGLRSAGRQDPVNLVTLQTRKHLAAHRLDTGLRFAVIQGRETRRRAGLQRKTAQQAFAEGVDGLDLQTTRRLQRPGKQAAHLVQLSGRRIAARHLAEIGLQGLRLHHRPGAEAGEETVLHLRRSRLGIGHAENLFRRHILEQEIDHAVHQDPCLAGAGIGLNEDTGLRPSGPALFIRRVLLDVLVESRLAHDPLSDPSVSLAALAHSPRRARWSKSP